VPARKHRTPTVLTPQELESFRRHGYVRVPQAFSPELARAMQNAIWDEIREDHGIARSDPSTWRPLPRSPHRAKHSPLSFELVSERFVGAISDLLGHDDWQRPATWGGFNLTFPEEPGTPWELRSDGWHWDGAPTSEGLLLISFYSEVRPGGGGTLALSGSPRLISDFYASLSPEQLAARHKVHRRLFARSDPWIADLNGLSGSPAADRLATFMEQPTEVRGVPCQVVELTGEPGDAVFCSLGMYHAVNRNCAQVPRIMRVKFLFLDETGPEGNQSDQEADGR
jgi:hypothetical protein